MKDIKKLKRMIGAAKRECNKTAMKMPKLSFPKGIYKGQAQGLEQASKIIKDWEQDGK